MLVAKKSKSPQQPDNIMLADAGDAAHRISCTKFRSPSQDQVQEVVLMYGAQLYKTPPRPSRRGHKISESTTKALSQREHQQQDGRISIHIHIKYLHVSIFAMHHSLSALARPLALSYFLFSNHH